MRSIAKEIATYSFIFVFIGGFTAFINSLSQAKREHTGPDIEIISSEYAYSFLLSNQLNYVVQNFSIGNRRPDQIIVKKITMEVFCGERWCGEYVLRGSANGDTFSPRGAGIITAQHSVVETQGVFEVSTRFYQEGRINILMPRKEEMINVVIVAKAVVGGVEKNISSQVVSFSPAYTLTSNCDNVPKIIPGAVVTDAADTRCAVRNYSPPIEKVPLRSEIVEDLKMRSFTRFDYEFDGDPLARPPEEVILIKNNKLYSAPIGATKEEILKFIETK